MSDYISLQTNDVRVTITSDRAHIDWPTYKLVMEVQLQNLQENEKKIAKNIAMRAVWRPQKAPKPFRPGFHQRPC